MTFKKGDPRPPGAGRKPGQPNKHTSEIKALAYNFAPKAIKKLVSLIEHSQNEAVVVSACKELLDRGIGRAVQPHSGEDGTGPVIVRVVTGVPRE
jgi:hypothetical protein